MDNKKPIGHRQGIFSFSLKALDSVKGFFSKIFLKIRLFFKKQSQKETVFFVNSKYSFSAKPFLMVQGLAVLLFSFLVVSLLVPPQKLNPSLVIKSVVVKQDSVAVAGGQPVQWTIFVSKKDITNKNYLVKLPKNASHINITTTTTPKAVSLLQSPREQKLPLSQRIAVAMANSQKPFLAASLLDSIGKFFTADLTDGVQSVIDSTNPAVQNTDQGTVVDLSSQAPTDNAQPASTPDNASTPATSSDSSLTTNATPSDNSLTQVVTSSDNSILETATPTDTTSSVDASLTDNTTPTSETTATDSILQTTTPTDNSLTEITTPEDNSLLQTTTPTSDSTVTDSTTSSDITNPIVNPVVNPIDQTTTPSDQQLTQKTDTKDVVQIDFQTPAPVVTEQAISLGKQVSVSAPTESPDQTPLTDVVASTTIPKLYKVGQEDKIHIKWVTNGDQNMTFHAYDTNGDGYLDYVEWTVPHLSDQLFEVIYISKAFQLDSNQNIIGDIYSQTEAKDNNWVTVTDGQYIRVTFNQVLSKLRDNTIYARPTNSASPATIDVYPVYIDSNGVQTEGPKVATFPSITKENMYKVYLTQLQTPTDVFDLKVSGSVDVDYIVDPLSNYYNYSDVLLVINDNSAMSQAIGSYFENARAGMGLNVLHLNSSVWPAGASLYADSNWHDEIYYDASSSPYYKYDYQDLIKTPIKNYIATLTADNGGTNPINYIILTKGIPIRITGTFNSVDSTLAGCLDTDCQNYGTGNPFYNTNAPFSHATYGVYLVTRLDGYAANGDVSGIEGMIDHSSMATILAADPKTNGVFVVDGGGRYPDSGEISSAVSSLTTLGWNVVSNDTATYITGQHKVIGYWSWGSNASGGTGLVRPQCLPGNTYMDGSIGETAVSTSGRTFTYPPSYGQSLIADMLAPSEGIAAMKGYVWEPYSSAVARPEILLPHYASGYNMADSYYAASSQIGWKDIVIGDPKMVISTILPPGPSAPVNNATINNTYYPTFSWTAAQVYDGATIDHYDLYIDGSKTDTVTGDTTSVTTSHKLSVGAHTWYVVATDSESATTTSATLNVTIAYSSFDLISPGNGTGVSALAQTFTWSDVTGPGSVTYQLKVNGSNVSATPSCSAGTCSASYTLPTTGSYTWNVVATTADSTTINSTSTFGLFTTSFDGYYTCYQENANSGDGATVGNHTNGSCGLVNTSSNYTTTGSTLTWAFGGPTVYDGKWNEDHTSYPDYANTNGSSPGDAYFNVTYAYPSGKTIDTANTKWRVEDDFTVAYNSGSRDLTIPQACWDYAANSNSNKLSLRIDSYFNGAGTGGLCVGPTTQVDTPSGEVQVQNLHQGDTIYSYNMSTHTVEQKTIQSIQQTTTNNTPQGFSTQNFAGYYYTLGFSNGQTVITTTGHEFYTGSAWVSAYNITLGTTVVAIDPATGNATTMTLSSKSSMTAGNIPVWDITTTDNDNFFAGDALSMGALQDFGGTKWQCQTGASTWQNILVDAAALTSAAPGNTGTGQVHEEAMNWAISATTPPSGGYVNYSNGYQSGTSAHLTVNDGTDNSTTGINTGSRVVKRASATLAAGSCTDWTDYSNVALTGSYAAGFDDANLASGYCYKYEYLVSDNAQNQATYTLDNGTSAQDIIKVDASTPSIPSAPLATNATSNSKPTWTWTASTDAVSGIDHYSFQWCDNNSFTGCDSDVATVAGDTTSYTNTSPLSAGTWYARVEAYSVGGIASGWSNDPEAVVDGTPPVAPGTPSIASSQNNNKPEFTWTAATDSGSGLANTPYTIQWCSDADFTTNCSTDTSISASYTSATAITNGKWYFRVKATDMAGNVSDWSSGEGVIIDTNNPGGGGSFNPLTTLTAPATSTLQSETTPTAITTPITTTAPQNIPEAVSQQINNVAQQITGLFTGGTANNSASTYVPPVEPTQQDLLQGLTPMTVNPLGLSTIKNISNNVSFFSDKFSELGKVLTSQSQVALPSLTAAISGSSSGQASAAPAIPVSQMTSEQISKIPSDVVFARAAGATIDIGSQLTVDSQGNAQQSITAVSGKPLDLIIKPGNPATSITGLLTLKKLKNPASAKSSNFLARLFNVALAATSPVTSSQDVFLLQKFNYVEKTPGVFVASITAPQAEGSYDIVTVVQYKDKKLTPTETHLATVVDPEGYVYESIDGKKARISGATVSIFWLNPDTKTYELWPADKFLQQNPVTTDDTGKYAFLVPQGMYYITASAVGYHDFKSDNFSVQQNNDITLDIALKAVVSPLAWLDWKIISLIIIGVLFVIVVFGFLIDKLIQHTHATQKK